MTQSNRLDPVLARLDAARSSTEALLFELLRIPSISAQPDHAQDCARTAERLAVELRAIGYDVSIDPTAGHPVVRAHHEGTAPGPHVLFYGHYDVQPPEPMEPWTSPPFEPRVLEGPLGRRVVARGSADDKGQVMTWLAALRAWHEVAGGPPVPVSVLIEGEEEVGSRNLDAYLAANAERYRADVAVISDTSMWRIDTPAITTSLRGMAYCEVTVSGASSDLHSGLYGGAALNPLNVLTRVLGKLHDERGRVTIPGFYDGIEEPSAAELEGWRGLGFDEATFLGAVGLSEGSGEQDRSALERLWARPTADINGIWGGYQGPGSKTVIARQAHAKMSFRLVPGQDPGAIAAAFERFVEAALPRDARASFQRYGTSPGFRLAADGPYMRAAREALQAEYGRPAALIGGGGSIPVVQTLKRQLGIDSLLVGFGLEDDGLHGPNEKFELECLHRGARSHARLLDALAGG